MYYIYILYSLPSDIYYVGYTNDYQRRLIEHNSSERNTFTGKHRPWILKAAFECGNDQAHAIRIEKFIKRQKNRKFIETVIHTDNLSGVLAQLVRVPDVRD